MRIEVHKAAAEETNRAVDYYEDARFGRGSRFLSRLSEAIALLQRHPLAAPVWAGDRTNLPVRRQDVRHFPYGVFYLVFDDHIHVLAVAHSRQESGYWMDRLGE